jgi:hypothetical protein
MLDVVHGRLTDYDACAPHIGPFDVHALLEAVQIDGRSKRRRAHCSRSISAMLTEQFCDSTYA